MELREEMFALIAEWKAGGLTKKVFLADRPISLSKFNYWCVKYNGRHQKAKLPDLCNAVDFHELLLSDNAVRPPPINLRRPRLMVFALQYLCDPRMGYFLLASRWAVLTSRVRAPCSYSLPMNSWRSLLNRAQARF